MTNEELLESINKRLALLIKANLSDKLDGKTRKEQVKMLWDLDFRREDIQEVLGISDNNLHTTLSRLRSDGEIDD